jgi:CHAT domain-containing protein/Tfp pilus assembly protein PilF
MKKLLFVLCVGLPGLVVGGSICVAAPTEQEVIARLEVAKKYHLAGDYSKARPIYEEVLREVLRLWGEGSLQHAAVLNNLGSLNSSTARMREAESMYLQCLKIYEAKLGPDHVNLTATLNNLGNLYLEMSRYPQAESCYKRALSIRERKLGPDHPETANALAKLATLYGEMSLYERAEPLFVRSLKIMESKLGPEHVDTIGYLNNLASLYKDMGRFEEARPLYLRCLRIRESTLGPDHQLTADSLNNLALLHLDTGKYEQAEPLFLRSLKIYETKLGPDHPDTARPLSNLGLVYRNTGRYDQAEQFYLRALKITEARFGPLHPESVATLDSVANLYAVRGQTSEAVARYDECRRAIRIHAARVLPIVPEAEQLTYLRRTDKIRLHRALTLSCRQAGDPVAAEHGAVWLLNAKGVSLETLAQTTLAARDSRDPKVASTFEELRTVRRELARLALTFSRPGNNTPQLVRRTELAAREQELTATLQRLGASVEPADPWVEGDQLRKALPDRSVFIDIARFNVYDLTKTDKEKSAAPSRYVAWVTPKRGPVHVVDLGDAKDVERAVLWVTTALDMVPQRVRFAREVGAEKETRKQLAALAERVIQPLRNELDGADRWIICPDGDLWLVPWSALPLDDKTYAIEKHAVQLVVSGRDLLPRAPAAAQSNSAPVVFADPDFDAELGPSVRHDGRMKLGKASRLAGTAAEAVAVAPLIEKYFGAAPKVLTKDQAAAAAFASLERPRALHLATHGFFFPFELTGDEKARLATDPEMRQRARVNDPLLQCGLLLAGSNHAAESASTGVLTGREILSTDLRGTELVVLSACETGLGRVSTGEGVAGLRQAFQLAGAREVVASLWRVPDRETADLMAGYYRELSQSGIGPEALQRAQIAQIASRRARLQAADPYFWAAFTLTGR